MVRHIVFFKLKNPTDELKLEVKTKLLSLKNRVSVLKYIEVGLNFSDEDRAYDLSLITDFNSKEDLNIYSNDPFHLEVVTFIKRVAKSTKVVDYIN